MLHYKWDTATSDSNPTSGYFKSSGSLQSYSTRTLYISKNAQGALDVSRLFTLITESVLSNKGLLTIYLASPQGTAAVITRVGQVTDAAGYVKIVVTPLVHTGGSFAAGADLYLDFETGWNFIPSDPRIEVASVNGHRLAANSSNPVDMSDQFQPGDVYLVPYTSDAIAIWNGSYWQLYNTGGPVPLGLTGLTTDKNYDVFAYYDSNPVQLRVRLELGPAWTDNTTRATGIVAKHGVWVKSGDETRRYIGSIRAAGSALTNFTNHKRWIWNVDNQVPVPLLSNIGPISSVNWQSATPRKLGGTDADSTVEALIGISGRTFLYGDVAAHGYSGAGGDAHVSLSIERDPFLIFSGGIMPNVTMVNGTAQQSTRVLARTAPLNQGNNWLRIVQYTNTPAITNNYQYGNHNLAILG